jgi:hypothetical protein
MPFRVFAPVLSRRDGSGLGIGGRCRVFIGSRCCYHVSVVLGRLGFRLRVRTGSEPGGEEIRESLA